MTLNERNLENLCSFYLIVFWAGHISLDNIISIQGMLRIASRVILRSSIIPITKIQAQFSDRTPFENNTQPTREWAPEQKQEQIKASQVIAKNKGMRDFLTKTYNTTAFAVIGALYSAYLGTSIPLLFLNPFATSLIGAIFTIGSFYAVQRIETKNLLKVQLGVPIYSTQNPPLRLLVYSLGVLSLGLSASPMFLYTQMLDPSIIPSAIGITAGIFGGASALAYFMPKDKMLGYGNILMGSLLGLIGMNIIGLLTSLIMGPNPFTFLLFRAQNYIGILLFSALIGYDTHIAIKQYENGRADHLGMSIQLLLDFWNILIRIMSIFSRKD